MKEKVKRKTVMAREDLAKFYLPNLRGSLEENTSFMRVELG